jgi:hypothetical protein
MPLERVRVEYLIQNEKSKQAKYGFRFIKNKQTSELYTSDEEVYEEFRKEIEYRCIQINFQERYRIEKMIGKGSFGRVAPLYLMIKILGLFGKEKRRRKAICSQNVLKRCCFQAEERKGRSYIIIFKMK